VCSRCGGAARSEPRTRAACRAQRGLDPLKAQFSSAELQDTSAKSRAPSHERQVTSATTIEGDRQSAHGSRHRSRRSDRTCALFLILLVNWLWSGDSICMLCTNPMPASGSVWRACRSTRTARRLQDDSLWGAQRSNRACPKRSTAGPGEDTSTAKTKPDHGSAAASSSPNQVGRTVVTNSVDRSNPPKAQLLT
jgi:hypothetical protein